jgi:exopolyphosphatase/guanosine-5'-triphosphate,3'-diphosphate pyrophosphatase
MKISAIDIGTNTILMLVAEVNEQGEIIPIRDFHEIARLGEGLNKNGKISDEALQRAIKILKSYSTYSNELGVNKIFCVGTAAFRDAKNSDEVIKKIRAETGIEVRVIDGELEAFLSYIGTISDNSYSVVLDIGGGSTEIIAGEGENIKFRKSLPIGAVKLTEKYFKVHPPQAKELDLAYRNIIDELSKVDSSFIKGKIYAVAGTPTTISAVVQGLKEYQKDKIENFVLTYEKIIWAKEKFLQLSVSEIIEKLYVPPKRADVILAGTIILEKFCELFKLPSIIVSDKGLRYGVAKYFSRKLN